MKKGIIIIIFTLLSLGAQAQFSINYSAGYADYQMKDMKDIMSLSMAEMPVSGARLVDNFPGYITHTLDIGYQYNIHELSVRFSYLTTGAKVAYADFSGKYEEKLIANGYRLGFSYRNYFYTAKIGEHSLSPFIELSPAVNFTSLTSKGKLTLSDGNESITTNIGDDDKVDINKTAFSAQVMAGSRIKLYKHFLVSISAGYDFSFGAKLSEYTEARIDWSGFRLNAGIGYMF